MSGWATTLASASFQRSWRPCQPLLSCEWIGPVASFRVATIVKRLPKTRSGKILRGTIKKIADGVEYRVPPTIDDPVILDEITADLSVLGYPPRVGQQSP